MKVLIPYMIIILIHFFVLSSCNTAPGKEGVTVSVEDSLASIEYSKRGVGLAISGNLQGAMEAYNDAIQSNPKSANAFGGRGMVRMSMNDLDGAFKDASRAIELDPLNGDWYGNRAYIRMQWGNYQEALRDLDRSLELNPSYGWAYTKRGTVKFLMKDTTGACEDWKVAMGMNEQEAVDSLMVHCY